LLDGTGRVDTHDDNDFDIETKEIGCKVREVIAFAFCISVFYGDVLSLYPSKVVKTLLERVVPEGAIGRRAWS
jgi:hypothetical protein